VNSVHAMHAVHSVIANVDGACPPIETVTLSSQLETKSPLPFVGILTNHNEM